MVGSPAQFWDGIDRYCLRKIYICNPLETNISHLGKRKNHLQKCRGWLLVPWRVYVELLKMMTLWWLISYNFHISRPNKIYLNLNWDQFLLAWKFGPSWGRFHAADRHIEMPLTKCFAVFFWGGILFFQRQRSTVSKKSLRCCFCFRKSGLCTIFFGVICDHLSPLSPSSLVWWGYAIVGLSTALVLELVSLHFSHWEFIDFHAIGGSAWWVVWKQNQGYFFVFEKDNLPMNQKRKWGIFLGIHLGISYARC